jgi:16S rRNA (uracil1498-N3)-methyltransferase
MRRRFFVEQFAADAAVLRGDAAHHLGRVLRAEAGQLYELSDGQIVWLARTEKIGKDTVEFALVEQLPARPSPLKITLLLAIVKFDRFEWAIEKATELGVDEIFPLAASRSEKGLIAASKKRAERWQKILLESAQQSRRLSVPLLRECIPPGAAFQAAADSIGLLLSEMANAKPMRRVLEPLVGAADPGKQVDLTIAIGPEGGWTEDELGLARVSKFAEVALGPNIMRTETAVTAAIAALQYAFGNLAQAAHAEGAALGRAGETL